MMKAVAIVLFIVFMLWMGDSRAQPFTFTYRTTDITIRLLGAICPHPAAAALLEPHSKLIVREAEVRRRDGIEVLACWVMREDGNILLSSTHAEIGAIHYSQFSVDRASR